MLFNRSLMPDSLQLHGMPHPGSHVIQLCSNIKQKLNKKENHLKKSKCKIEIQLYNLQGIKDDGWWEWKTWRYNSQNYCLLP